MPKSLSAPRALVFAAAVLGAAFAATGPASAQWSGYGGPPAPGYGAPPPPPPPGWQRGPNAGPPGWQRGPYAGPPRWGHRVCRTHYQRVVVRRPYAPPLVTVQPVRDCRWVR